MTRYITNYYSGSKGEFLANFINNKTYSVFETRTNKARNNYDTYRYNDDYEALKNNFNKFDSDFMFNSHTAHLWSPAFRKAENITLINITASKKYFKTMGIEFIFKNFCRLTDCKIVNGDTIDLNSSDINKPELLTGQKFLDNFDKIVYIYFH